PRAHSESREDSAQHFVILAYQHIGADSLPQGNIDIETFAAHITELKAGGYTVLPLRVAVERLKARKPFPDKSVVITFDGAWRETAQNAFPLLDAENMPYTVFIASDMAENQTNSHLSWPEIIKLRNKKRVDI